MADRKEKIAQEISETVPTFIRHMYSFVFFGIELSPAQVITMVAVQEKGPCPLGELSREMHVSAPTITGIVDRLEKSGYVKRVLCEKDRRVRYVILTKKGENLVQKFRANIKKRWEYILTKIPAESGENLIMIMKQITKGFVDGEI